MLDESHSSRNSNGRNEERHGAKAGSRRPGSDREAMGDGMMVVVVVVFDGQKKPGDTLDGSEGGGAGGIDRNSKLHTERGAADAPRYVLQRYVCKQVRCYREG